MLAGGGLLAGDLGFLTPGLEHVAAFTVPEVEFVADDRPVHRVSAVDQLPIDDGVGAEVFGQVGSAARVPAIAMTFFRVHEAILAGNAALLAGKDKLASPGMDHLGA
jgi:hypothetical protein